MPKAKKELKINLDFFRNIFNNVPVSINIFDKSGKRILVNPYFYHISGRDSSKGFTQELTNDGTRKNDYLFGKINQALNEGKISEVFNFSFKSRLTTTRRFLDFIIGPLREANGEIIGAYSIAKDGTARNLANKKMLRLNATLEKKVVERTDELTRANNKLKKLSSEKSLLISNVAHEIKTILTIIRGNLDLLLLERKNKNPLELEYNEEIRREIEKMSKLVSDLVSISRAESYANSLERELLNPLTLIKEALRGYGAIQKKKKIIVSVKNVSTGRIRLCADKAKITTLVSNLIENSFKFGKERGKLEITLKQDEKRVYLIFEDDGCGIEKQMLGLITEPFFQVKKTGSRNIEKRGFGLGLAICQKIVLAHRGTLKVKSGGLGKGATFIVMLPKGTLTKIVLKKGVDNEDFCCRRQ